MFLKEAPLGRVVPLFILFDPSNERIFGLVFPFLLGAFLILVSPAVLS